jgi:hypothetical protein
VIQAAARFALRHTWLLAALLCALSSSVVRAEATAKLVTDSEQVEVGKPIAVQLSVSSDEGSAESPRLDVPAAFGTRGPSVSRRFSTSISGFSATTKRELVATWNVITNTVGQYTLGPARAVVDGKTITSNTVSINVVAAGTLPSQPKQAQRPGSLLDDDDFFKGFPGLGRSRLDDLFGPKQADLLPEAPLQFKLEQARDSLAFLNATVTPETAVVGQQVTLRIVAYGAAGMYRENDPREPRRADFYSISMMDNATRERVYTTRIGSSDYVAVKVREYALFPLKAGKLEIGPMKMQFYGSNYVSRTTGVPIERESQPLIVDVQEPPIANRPIDYQVGDVGSYRLTATVSPKNIEEGDSFSVVATLEGEGNPPQALRIPEQSGLEWLQPTLTEQLQVNTRKRVEGSRTFTYIVKATRAGTFELGELRLPYFDPSVQQYKLAAAQLGSVVVKARSPAVKSSEPGAQASDDKPEANEISLADLAQPRVTLSSFEPRDRSWARSPWLWWLMLGVPALAFSVKPMSGHLTTLSSRRRERLNSLANQVRQQLQQAEKLLRAGDDSGALGALERALFLGIEDATGVKARALLRTTLRDTLVAHGLTDAQASETTSLLNDVESYRFGGAGVGLSELSKRAQKLVNTFSSRTEAA